MVRQEELTLRAIVLLTMLAVSVLATSCITSNKPTKPERYVFDDAPLAKWCQDVVSKSRQSSAKPHCTLSRYSFDAGFDGTFNGSSQSKNGFWRINRGKLRKAGADFREAGTFKVAAASPKHCEHLARCELLGGIVPIRGWWYNSNHHDNPFTVQVVEWDYDESLFYLGKNGRLCTDYIQKRHLAKNCTVPEGTHRFFAYRPPMAGSDAYPGFDIELENELATAIAFVLKHGGRGMEPEHLFQEVVPVFGSTDDQRLFRDTYAGMIFSSSQRRQYPFYWSSNHNGGDGLVKMHSWQLRR